MAAQGIKELEQECLAVLSGSEREAVANVLQYIKMLEKLAAKYTHVLSGEPIAQRRQDAVELCRGNQ